MLVAKKTGKKPAASKSAPSTAAKRPVTKSNPRVHLKASAKSGGGLGKPVSAKTVGTGKKPGSAAKPVLAESAKAPAGKGGAAKSPVAQLAPAKSPAGKLQSAKAPAPVNSVDKSSAAAAPAKPDSSTGPAAVAAKKPAKASSRASAKPAIPMAEKSTVVTAYAKVPGLAKPSASASPAKKAPRLLESKPVRLPPPPVTSDSKTQKNRGGLNAREVEHFRDLLLEKRRELLGDVSSMETSALRSGNSNLSTLPIHMADAGTDNYEQEFTLGLVEKDRQLMREINVALAKIQDGSYGICEGTGKPIAKPRLEAQPWARYSIEHARALEKPQFRRAF